MLIFYLIYFLCNSYFFFVHSAIQIRSSDKHNTDSNKKFTFAMYIY